jgi:methylenetetrahydrofolate dehydrogenase (NADP+)/methenyltetrahydrofolate cyclohydrolase
LTAELIDGKKVAKDIKAELKTRVEVLKDSGITPGLAAVQIGENPASTIYVNSKSRACQKIGMYSEVVRKPENIEQPELSEIITELNKRSDIDGILVQSPLPGHIDEMALTLQIDPSKDVDGFHPYNVGMTLLGRPTFLSCTPYGIIELMRRYQIDPEGKEVVILGRSNIVGKPLAAMLIQKWPDTNATVTVCHSRTQDIESICRRADILVAAIGQPEFVRSDMVKDGVVIIDVGQNLIEDSSTKKGNRLVGDVDFTACSEKASYITPVPGGVGPMTIAMLLTNTVISAENRLKKNRNEDQAAKNTA